MMIYLKNSGLILIGYCFLCLQFCFAGSHPPNWKKVKVLVYTRNGKGYVHDNIAGAVACIQQLGRKYGFKVDVSDHPVVFEENNLKQYTLLIFPSTNNEVFDTDAQKLAFMRYVQAGGGFVGIHAAIGTERNWKWFKMMIGGSFAWHAKFQPFRVKVIDPGHPSVQGVPKIWERHDECYFEKEIYPGIRVVMAHELGSLDEAEKEKVKTFAAPFADLYPAVWYQHFDGGHIWCTTLGHDKKDYSDPVFINHIFQGIRWVASQVKKLDYTKAYATSPADAVQY